MLVRFEKLPEEASYDVIVVGAGGAGMTAALVAAIDGARVLVRSLEAVDGTPILDIKGLLNPDIQQR